MAKEEAKAAKKTKRPTALKRDMQSKKRNVRNRAYKSKVGGVVKDFQEALKKGEAKENLKTLFSIVDKGVKKGIIKANKASRMKSRASLKVK
jgi:small subunit ribosomal protein S20